MELIIKKPEYANGVYIALQFIRKIAYVGESKDIFRRMGEHICGLAGVDFEGYGSNENLINEEDKRIELFAIYNNVNQYRKMGLYTDLWKPWIYDETLYMFAMRKYGYTLYNVEKDNTGYGRSFIISAVLTSVCENQDKYQKEILDLEQKTIEYLIKKFNITEDAIKDDLKIAEENVKNIIFKNIKESIDTDNLKNIAFQDVEKGIWPFETEDLEQMWKIKVSNIKAFARNKRNQDLLSGSYDLICDQKEALKYARELSGENLRKDSIELCGIETLSRIELSNMIRSKKMDTTIFMSFGSYLGQLATTILATKSEDMKKHQLVQAAGGKWKIEQYDMDNKTGGGFCEWSFKGLDEIDTRNFFETTNDKEKSPKYVFFTYTPSKAQAGEINTPGLNPIDNESFSEFKERMERNILKQGKDIVGKKIEINWNKKEKDIINVPESMFPEVIAEGENRTLLISHLYVLDGYVNNYKKLYEYYWEHVACESDNGRETCSISDVYHNNIEKDKYDKVEKIGEDKYRGYKEHREISSGQRKKCARIRSDHAREELADMVVSKEFYDESEANKDFRNVIIAELVYPYIATIKEK